MDEFAAIARFVRAFPRAEAAAGVWLGPGDDAALLKVRPGHALVATTDVVREGVHFGPRFRPAEIGHKALAVNLSDLAAMGAQPRWMLVAIELPAGFAAARLDGVARGMAALAQRHGCALAGGNFSSGPRLALTVTALGEVARGLALRRDGLRSGQLLAVTGRLGGAASGLRALTSGSRRGAQAQLVPTPRVEAGLVARGRVSAAIDVSDGLAQDAGHLAERSGCGVVLWEEALPVASGATRSDALSGGEDYELLFGLDRSQVGPLARRLAKLELPLTVVGEALSRPGLWLAERRGDAPRRPRRLTHLGHRYRF